MPKGQIRSNRRRRRGQPVEMTPAKAKDAKTHRAELKAAGIFVGIE